MTTDEPIHRMTLIVECAQVSECSVIFEPFGAEHTLVKGDAFRVEIAGPGDGEALIWYGPGAISIIPWVGGDYVAVRNRAGIDLPT